MTVHDVIARLRRHGVYVTAEEGRLKLRAPAKPPAETRLLIEELRRRKVEVLAALTTWSTPRAGEMLVAVQRRLDALRGSRPIPPMDAAVSAAYDRLTVAHDGRDWPAFVEAVAAFEAAWKERICKY